MIETLFQLVRASGIERMNLSIQSSTGDRATVCVQCILGSEPKDATPEQRDLRHALAQPIAIEGLVGEVDAKLDEILTNYVKAATPLANSLITNIADVKSGLEKADKKQSKANQKASEAPKEEGAAIKNENDDDDEFQPDEAESL